MMIEREVFLETIAALERRFRQELHEDDVARLYEYLSERMDTEAFQAASRAVWATNRFFPRPADFLLVEQTVAWRRLQQVLRDFRPPHNTTDPVRSLTPRALQAVRDLGGLLALKDELQRSPLRCREAFVNAYEAVVTTDAHDVLLLTPGEP